MNNILNLLELTTSQLEGAIMTGEGVKDCEILEIVSSKVLKAVWLPMEDGTVKRHATHVRYQVIIEDEMEPDNELNAGIFVEVTAVGIVAKF